IPEMIAAYAALLERFPETEGLAEARYWMGTGHFDLEAYDKAVPELAEARELDAAFEDRATLRIVIAHYQLENMAELAAESKRYLEAPAANEPGEAAAKRTPIPSQILEYLGRKLAADKELEPAEYF